ncbi:D-alanyl-D-alanine dipeptidase, partial [Halomonas sp. BBD48]|nr:D-alanyl-D-alanine dipeptidase [Halomonas sp. BBD48]
MANPSSTTILADRLPPIPTLAEPHWETVSRLPIQGDNAPLVPMSLAPLPIKVFPAYAKLGIPGAVAECYVREDVYRRLLAVARSLPSGLQ